MSEEKKEESKKTGFDPDLMPSNPQNIQAAKDHHLRYDPRRRAYVDEDGCLIRDQFGQRF